MFKRNNSVRDIDKYADEALAINRMVEHNLSTSMHLTRSSSTFFYAEIQQQQEQQEAKLNEIKQANEPAFALDQSKTPTGSPTKMFSVGDEDDEFNFDEFDDKFSFVNYYMNATTNTLNDQSLDHVDTMTYLFSNKLRSDDDDKKTKSIQIRPRSDEDDSSLDYFLASSVDTVINAPYLRAAMASLIPTVITPSSTSSSSTSNSIQSSSETPTKKSRNKKKKKKKSAPSTPPHTVNAIPPPPPPTSLQPLNNVKQLFSSIVSAVASSVVSSVHGEKKKNKTAVLNPSHSDPNFKNNNNSGGKKKQKFRNKPQQNSNKSNATLSIDNNNNNNNNNNKSKAVKANSNIANNKRW